MGDLIQCRGVADALAVEAEEKTVAPGSPWVWFMPWGPIPPHDRPGHSESPLDGVLPDLVIASGRRTLAYVRAVKKMAREAVFTVYLKDPRTTASYIDLIWVPEHDGRRGDNVVVTLTSPHRYSPTRITREFGELPGFLSSLPAPRIAVLLGGHSRDFTFDDADNECLALTLKRLAKQGAGVAVTASRRTPAELVSRVRNELRDVPHYWWDGTGDNPYGHLLAHSDITIVTADSTNMVMEACVTGRPVYVFRPGGGSKKIDRMLERLISYGAVRLLPSGASHLETWCYEPLYAADRIADAIRMAAATARTGG